MAVKKHKRNHVVLAVLVLVLAGGFYFYNNFSGIVVRTAERIASDAIGVDVDIGSISFSLTDKKVTVNNLKIGNPPGYSKPYVVEAESIVIGLKTANKELIDFNDITVKGSVVNLEVNEQGMNLIDLKNIANRKKQKESVGAKQIRVIVRHMVIEASQINPTITLLKHDVEPIDMPPVHFTNLGSGGNTDAGEVITQVLSKYLSAAQNAAREEGMLKGLSIPGVNDAKTELHNAVESIKGLFR